MPLRLQASMIIGCMILLICLLPVSAHAARTESVFQAANQYTVKINTMVQTPFDDDKKGSFTGTGFLVDAGRGWILTNAHVVSRSPSNVRISFKGGEDVSADKLYVDPLIDVAILQVPAKKVPGKAKSAPLACRKMPKAGNPVGVFGHPWGFDYTATRGIVSGYTYREGMHLLQTDAPVNHGNSGGPLISVETGKVVGITMAMLNRVSAKRMNFAVPIKYACKILSLMKKGKDPAPPVLPVVFFDNKNKVKPLKVARVYASKADFPLKPGDEINQVGNGHEQITNAAILVHLLRGHAYNPVPIRIKRNGKNQVIKFRTRPMKKVTNRQGVYVSGLLIADVPYVDKDELKLGHNLMVHDVENSSIAASLGVEDDDFLVSVNKKAYQTAGRLHAGLKKLSDAGVKAHLIIKRLSGTGGKLFSYHEVDLPVSGLRFIGSLKE